jgi:hypothetical protein
MRIDRHLSQRYRRALLAELAIGQQIDAAVAVGELVKDEAEEVLIDGRALDARKPLAFTPSKHR